MHVYLTLQIPRRVFRAWAVVNEAKHYIKIQSNGEIANIGWCFVENSLHSTENVACSEHISVWKNKQTSNCPSTPNVLSESPIARPIFPEDGRVVFEVLQARRRMCSCLRGHFRNGVKRPDIWSMLSDYKVLISSKGIHRAHPLNTGWFSVVCFIELKLSFQQFAVAGLPGIFWVL